MSAYRIYFRTNRAVAGDAPTLRTTTTPTESRPRRFNRGSSAHSDPERGGHQSEPLDDRGEPTPYRSPRSREISGKVQLRFAASYKLRTQSFGFIFARLMLFGYVQRDLFENSRNSAARDAELGRETAGRWEPGAGSKATDRHGLPQRRRELSVDRDRRRTVDLRHPQRRSRPAGPARL